MKKGAEAPFLYFGQSLGLYPRRYAMISLIIRGAGRRYWELPS